MSIYKELSYDNDIESIKGIRFCILSPDEIKRMSVAEISNTNTFQFNEPVMNGLFDPRMGVLDNNKLCHTCHQKNTFCPGHFGHIVLAKPVFYIQFFDIVKKLLRCVCFRCSKLLIDPDSDEVKSILNKKYSRQKKWELLSKMCAKVRRCGGSDHTYPGCGAQQPDKVYRDQIVKIVMEWKASQDDKMVLYAEDVHTILSRISDRDSKVLGFSPKFNRPEWMICTVLPVPPPAVRPSVKSDTGQRSEDDLTHKLCDIVKNNNTLKQKIERGVPKDQIDIASQVLQYHVATFIDNSIPGISPAQQRTGRLLKSLTERLKSKEGRIRGNLMGKRVDFSARSVITPDPNISIDELGVPIKIAMNLTYPEIVNKYNLEKLTELVRNGPDVYPGAKYLRKPSKGNQTKWLKKIDRGSLVLEEGDVVDRHLMDGDYVLFNRQPSLHKMSMMGHRIKVMPFNTFRLNPLVCVSFNADFDGDEMNLHVPQSAVTEHELRAIAAVPYQIMSPKECKPIVAVVQDVALGIYRMTKKHVTLNEKQLFNLMSTNPRFLGDVPKPSIQEGDIKKWSGQQALSSIIPSSVNLRAANKSYDETIDDKDNFVVIENGVIKQGTVDKDIYQKRSKGLIHSIYNDCNEDETRMFFDNTQKLICNWLVYSGFSVGISDLIVDESTQGNLKSTINDMKVQVYDIIRDIHMNKFENLSINDNNDYFETEINKILNKAREQTGKLGLSKINDFENRMINMIKSGSKGSSMNVAQMIACVGQQNVDGKRIAYGFDHRTLPHFVKYDDGPDSRGFVENSFISGLTPQEFFFHSMGGREGLIDTAVKTSETGYLQRKLVKAMEDCKIAYDYTVRNASGSIIQFLYGEDGMNPIKIESQSLPYIMSTYEQLYKDYMLSYDDIEGTPLLMKDVQTQIGEVKSDFDARMKKHFDDIVRDREYVITKVFNGKQENTFMYPISFARIINNAKSTLKTFGMTVLSDLNPMYVLNTIEQLCDELYVSRNNKGNMFLHILLKCYLSPKQVMQQYRFTKDVFDHVVQQIKARFYEAIASPSEMVGVVAAQSIGEPATQLTLNTFHHSGISSASKAVRGVPRIKELLSVTKNIKSPSMVICLKDEVKRDKMASNKVLKSIHTTLFKDIVKSTKIYFDADDFNTDIDDDRSFVDTYRELVEHQLHEMQESSPWLLRIEIDREKLLDEGLNMLNLYTVLNEFYGDTINCMFSDDNSGNLIFRIKLPDDPNTPEEEKDHITDLKALEKNIMDNTIIKGVKNIQKAIMNKQEQNLYNVDTMSFEKDFEWVISTAGTNMVDVMSHPGVDYTKTVSNDVNEIYDILGIEAARQAMYNELFAVIDSAELYVNYRHLALLVDTMTNRGYLLSIDRHGINRVDFGPLAKCSFEETTDMLIKAGIFAEVDKINGVSANIMLGQIPPCGTGDCEVLIDEHKLINMLDDTPSDVYNEDEYQRENADDDGDACAVEKMTFDFSFDQDATHAQPKVFMHDINYQSVKEL